jgi:hypothetical protein
LERAAGLGTRIAQQHQSRPLILRLGGIRGALKRILAFATSLITFCAASFVDA